MQILTILIGVLAFWFGVLKPLLRDSRRTQERKAAEKMYYFKLKWVRRWHPDLKEMSIKEIEETYHINDSYEMLQYRKEFSQNFPLFDFD